MGSRQRDIRLELIAEIEAALRKIKKFDQEGLDPVERRGKSMSRTFSGMGTAVKGFLSTLAVQQVVQFGLETAKLAGQAKDLRGAMANLATKEGVDVANIMEELRKRTAGTISDIELMKKATLGKFLGIDLKNMPTLLEFARRRAKETGEDINFLAESLVTGIGRRSILRLDNLGISMDQIRQEVKNILVETGKWTGAVSDNTLQLNFQQAALRVAQKSIAEAGEQADTAADKTNRLAASWENLKVNIGRVAAGPANIFLDSINNLLSSFNDAVDPAKQLDRMRQSLIKLNKEIETIEQSGTALQRFFALPIFQQNRLNLVNEIAKLTDEMNALESAGKKVKLPLLNDEEVRRQAEIAKLIRKLRLEEAVLGAKDEFDARRIQTEAQYQEELKLAKGNAAAIEQLNKTHKARLTEIAEDEAENQRKIVEKRLKDEKRLLDEAYQNELDSSLRSLENVEDQFEKQRELIEKFLKNDQERYNEALDELRDQIDKFNLDIKLDAIRQVGGIVESTFTSLAGSLVDSATTGSEAWANFFSDLKRQITQFLISNAVRGLLNFVASVLFPGSSIGNVFGAAFNLGAGGSANRGTSDPTNNTFSPGSGGGLRLGSLPAPSISPVITPRANSVVRSSEHTIERIARVEVESLFPDHNRVRIAMDGITDNHILPRTRYVEEHLSTKRGEFDE